MTTRPWRGADHSPAGHPRVGGGDGRADVRGGSGTGHSARFIPGRARGRRPGRFGVRHCVRGGGRGQAERHAGDHGKPAEGEGRPADRGRHRATLGDLDGLLGQAAGSAGRDCRLQVVRQAHRGAPRVRRRPRVLPRLGVQPRVPAADKPARCERIRDLRALPPRHVGQDWRLPGFPAHRRLQDRAEPAHRKDVHSGTPRNVGVAQPGPVRTVHPGRRRGPEEDAGRGAPARGRWPLPRGGRGPGRPRR